jgi:hypothetical protein
MTKKSDAQDLITRITTLRLEGKAESAEAMRNEAEAAVKACAPKDRKALTAELETAFTLEPTTEAELSAELTLSSYHEVEGVDGLVQEAVGHVVNAVDEGLKAADMARSIAETLLEARLLMPNKHGLADIVADSKYTKNIAHDTFVKAREGVSEEDVDRWATHQSLAKAVRNRMSDVMVERLRSLDAKPENFPADTMAKARAEFPKLSPTEAVYALYEKHDIKLPRKGRTELAREDARARAALLKAAQAGELPAGDDSAADATADIEAVERLENSFVRLAHRAEKRSPEDRAKVKARINAAIASLAAEAARL